MSEASSDSSPAGSKTQGATPGIICSAEEIASLARDIVGRGGTLRFQARGSSMFPLIQNNDLVRVKALAADYPRLGEIVLIQDAGGVVKAHRVIRRGRRQANRLLTTMGDNSLAPDDPVCREEIIGQIVTAERGGKIIDLTRNDLSWLAWSLDWLGIALAAAGREKAVANRKQGAFAAVVSFIYWIAAIKIRIVRRLVRSYLIRKSLRNA